jgi:carbamoylphosphate synthase large subunit
MKHILIVALSPKWYGIARLPKALKEAGFIVTTLSHRDSFLCKSMFIDFNYTFFSSWDFRKKLNIIVSKHPIDFIIPGCDNAVSYFTGIFRDEGKQIFRMDRLKTILLNSTNNANAFETLGNKSNLQQLAVKNKVLNPNNKHYNSSEELLRDINSRDFPLVLKKDFGAAGSGVKICNTRNEAAQALKNFEKKNSRMGFKEKINQFVRRSLALPYNMNKNDGISVQNYIEGTPCMHLVFASKGKVLSSVTLLKVECYPDQTSPSSVIKPIRHKQITEDSEKIIEDCNVTGFYSFDYVINSRNEAYILECNPRPTPVTHLSHLCGGNLILMLKMHLTENESYVIAYPEIIHEYIALFPNEHNRDPQSEYLSKGFHDVPEGEKLLT